MNDLATAPPEAPEDDPVSALEAQMRKARDEYERRLANLHHAFVAKSVERVRELHQALDKLLDDFVSADVGLETGSKVSKLFGKSLGDMAQLIEFLDAWIWELAGSANGDQ